MSSDILQTRLSCGLRVSLKEIHSAPLASHWLFYGVGSRDEQPGATGISHWVEHMQFKGTPAYPAAFLDRAIARQGGSWNAFTYLDWTAYYETLPAEHIDLGIQLEADRMQNSLFEEEAVESERKVILAEREGSENEPLFRLGEAVQSAAFSRHPYRNEVIGLREDLEKLTRAELFAHYRENYHPGNALLCMAGDFESERMLERIDQLYRDVPARPAKNRQVPPDPPPQGNQRLEMSGPGEAIFIEVVYRAPAAADPDFFAFTVLDSLLSGPASLNMFGGGGISNRTSRLYRSLVEKELAVSASGGLQATLDPHLYDTVLTLHPRCSVEALLAAFDAEIARLQDNLVEPAEIERAVKQARALFAYSSENITNQAFWMGYSEMFANYSWFSEYTQHMAQVTAADIQRIAQEYLLPERRVVGVYLPNGTPLEMQD